MPIVATLIRLFAQSVAATLSERLASHLAAEVVCAASKGCPVKTDAIAADAKARAEARTKKAP